jgi:acyl carrier protein
MRKFTADEVRDFLTAKYSEAIRGMGLDPAAVGDDFDFLLSGVVDSFGILEMVSSIEQQFGIELDLASLEAEQMTILGPLSRYVAETAK